MRFDHTCINSHEILHIHLIGPNVQFYFGLLFVFRYCFFFFCSSCVSFSLLQDLQALKGRMCFSRIHVTQNLFYVILFGTFQFFFFSLSWLDSATFLFRFNRNKTRRNVQISLSREKKNIASNQSSNRHDTHTHILHLIFFFSKEFKLIGFGEF